MRKSVLGAILALFVVLAPSAMAQSKRAVTILAEEDKPPYSYAQDGEFRGISIEILRAVFSNTQYELELAAPTRSQIELLNKQGELGEAGFYPGRSEMGSFVRSDPLFSLKHCLYTRASYGKVSVANAPQFRVGVRDEPYLVELARSHLGVSGYVPYGTARDGVEMLLGGDVDVLFDDEEVMEYVLDAMGKRESVTLQQSGLFAVPVSIVLPDYMADMMDELNVRISQVHASGLTSRLLNDASRQLFAFDIQNGNVMVPFAAVGIIALLLIFVVVYMRSSALKRSRELEALCDSFPALVLSDSGVIAHVNKPMKELFSFLKLQAGKRFEPNLRFENAETGLMEMPPGQSVDDALLVRADTVLWRGSLKVSRVKYRVNGSAELCSHIAFETLSGLRSRLCKDALFGVPASFKAYCQNTFETLGPLLLADAMAVYTADSGACVPLFETIKSDDTLRSMCAKLYGAVESGGVRALSPGELVELAARCGARYTDHVRFIVAPLAAENGMAAMLWLRTRVTRWEVSDSDLDAVKSVAWRLGRALRQFDQDERLSRSVWFDSVTLLPNSACFDQLLEQMCSEEFCPPAFLRPYFKGIPSQAAVVLIQLVPCDDEAMTAAAKELGGLCRFAARVGRDAFGLLVSETDVTALRDWVAAAMEKLLEALPEGTRKAGAARYPFDSLSGQGLLSRAYDALGEAGKNDISIFMGDKG